MHTQTKPQTYGNPQPTPNPIFSGKVIMMTVEIIAIHMKPTPQNHVNTIIIRRNIGLTSYRFITLLRYTIPPWPSIPPASSMMANSAGRHGFPFSVDDILNGSGRFNMVRIADVVNIKPNQKHIVGEGIAHKRTHGLVGIVPMISSISTKVMAIRTLTWRNSNIPHLVHPTGLHLGAVFARKSFSDRKP